MASKDPHNETKSTMKSFEGLKVPVKTPSQRPILWSVAPKSLTKRDSTFANGKEDWVDHELDAFVRDAFQRDAQEKDDIIKDAIEKDLMRQEPA